MKKIIYTAIALISIGFYNPIKAQAGDGVTNPSGYFEFSFGLAEPVGNFVKHPGSAYSGYAMSGDNFNISLGIPISQSNFGVALMYGYYHNNFDMNNYVNYIATTDSSKKPYQVQQQSAYNENIIMGGLYATIPFQNLSIDFRVMGGAAFCNLPEVSYSATQSVFLGTDNYSWDTYASKASAFAFGAGADIRYRFGFMSLMVGIDYLTATPTVNTTQQYTDPSGNISYSHVSGNMPISLVSAYIGIAYQIW